MGMTIPELAFIVRGAIGRHTAHRVWFDGMTPEVPVCVPGADVWGRITRVTLTSALPGGFRIAAQQRKDDICVDSDRSTWWDYELVVRDGERWELTAKAPQHLYPGWGRREVARGKLSDDHAKVEHAIQYACGPLELLIMDKNRDTERVARRNR